MKLFNFFSNVWKIEKTKLRHLIELYRSPKNAFVYTNRKQNRLRGDRHIWFLSQYATSVDKGFYLLGIDQAKKKQFRKREVEFARSSFRLLENSYHPEEITFQLKANEYAKKKTWGIEIGVPYVVASPHISPAAMSEFSFFINTHLTVTKVSYL